MSCIPGALVIALGLAASAELAAAQGGRVEGRVTAAASGAPIPSAEVSVVGTNLVDVFGHGVDVDGDGTAGGTASIEFDTLPLTTVPGTMVTGRVFASEQTTVSA